MIALSLPLIIEVETLRGHLGHPDLLIIDLCNEQNYAAGHIPGAIHVEPAELVAGTPPAPGKLPPLERLNRLFSRIGWTPEKHLVVYDDEGGGWAGRFIWTLDMIGHHAYSYLNGGLWAWHAAGGPLSTDIPQPEPGAVSLSLSPNAPAADIEEILANVAQPRFVVWDARSADEFHGRRVTAAKNGHIPGAIHCDWLELMDRQRNLRIRNDVREVLASKGITGDLPIVTHCQTHHRSGLSYLVGKMLGYTIRAYPGSWSEWGNHPATPVNS